MVKRVEYLIDEEQKSYKKADDPAGDDDFPSFDEYELPKQKVIAARAQDPRASEIFDMDPEKIANFWGEEEK